MAQVSIKYFAQLREQSGKSEEDFQTQAQTLRDLYVELVKKYQFSLDVKYVRAAVCSEYRDMNESFKDGDQITFIPPVAGG